MMDSTHFLLPRERYLFFGANWREIQLNLNCRYLHRNQYNLSVHREPSIFPPAEYNHRRTVTSKIHLNVFFISSDMLQILDEIFCNVDVQGIGRLFFWWNPSLRSVLFYPSQRDHTHSALPTYYSINTIRNNILILL